jgi:hypothetical protein
MNWQILATISAAQFFYAFLATRVWPLTCGSLSKLELDKEGDALLSWPWLERVGAFPSLHCLTLLCVSALFCRPARMPSLLEVWFFSLMYVCFSPRCVYLSLLRDPRSPTPAFRHSPRGYCAARVGVLPLPRARFSS